MKIALQFSGDAKSRSGMTLVEVLVSLGVGSLIFGGVLTGYVQSANRAQWASYDLAGQSMAMAHLEMARVAKWDTQVPTDDLVSSNFPPIVEVLDVPLWSTNLMFATNTTFITAISSDPPLKMIRIETVWSFLSRGLFTNVTATYRSPDQ